MHHIEKYLLWKLYTLTGSIFYATACIRLLNDELLFRNMLKVYSHDVVAVPDFYKDVMGRTCSTHGEQARFTRGLVGRSQRKRPLGRSWRRWDDNVDIYLTVIG